MVERPPTLLQKESVKPLTLILGLSESRALDTKKGARSENIQGKLCAAKACHIQSTKDIFSMRMFSFPMGKGTGNHLNFPFLKWVLTAPKSG